MTGAALSSAGAGAPRDSTLHEVMLQPSVPPTGDAIRVTVVMASFPGLSERASCRMQVTSANQGAARLSTRVLLKTVNDKGDTINSWLVPTGDLKPGEESLRTYSCKAPESLVLVRGNPFAWPQTCSVDGIDTLPCPVALRMQTNLPFADGK